AAALNDGASSPAECVTARSCSILRQHPAASGSMAIANETPGPCPSIAAGRTDAKGQVLTRLNAAYKRRRASEGPAGGAGGAAFAVPSSTGQRRGGRHVDPRASGVVLGRRAQPDVACQRL